jgi:hypothetical protein
MPVVKSCPCGEEHEIPQAIEALWDRSTVRFVPTVVVSTAGGRRWHFPRIYIECHGLTDLAAAAERYGFEKA